MSLNKLYVFVSKSLTLPQQAVQAGHAVSKIAAKNPGIDWSNQTFVYLRASDIKLFKLLMNKQQEATNTFSYFEEPDYNNRLTAIAVFGGEDDYSNYALMK